MNNFIERIDQRRRDQEAIGHVAPEPEVVSPYDMRLAAEALLQQAAENRDKASCVTGGKQRSMIILAERKEAEAKRLLLDADRILSSSMPCKNNVDNRMPVQKEIPMYEEAPRHCVEHNNQYSDNISHQYVNNAAMGQMGRANSNELDGMDMMMDGVTADKIEGLLAKAAENRDKASCVKGGKNRALISIAERLENEALALRKSNSELFENHSLKSKLDANCVSPSTLPTEKSEKSEISEPLEIPMSPHTNDGLYEQIYALEQEALLYRDKASCVTGSRQRQLINFAEMKERKIEELKRQFGYCEKNHLESTPFKPIVTDGSQKAAGLNSRGVNRMGTLGL